MSQHPLDSISSPTDPFPTHENSEESYDSFPPLTDDDLSSFEKKLSFPVQVTDNAIVRAQSPFGRRYLKPINGIQIKGFARSAQRRSSVMTLGSIERLQNYYASKDLKVNKGGTLGFQNTSLTEEPEELILSPQEPPPSWVDLDVITDLDVLLKICFDDIQSMLTVWSMVTDSQKVSPDTEEGFQILPLLESITKMLSSVKNYTVNRNDLSHEASTKLRNAALSLLETVKELETQYRVHEEDDEEEADGFLYRSSDSNTLENERKAIHNYLNTVEEYAFNPPHNIGSPPAEFTPEIKALMGEYESTGSKHNVHQTKPTLYGVPEWLQRSTFVNDPMGRYHNLILDSLDGSFQKEDVPDPKTDEDAFLECLADGIILCNIFNSLVKRSRRPFGLITKIHSDSKRTYRAIENLRFFSTACKFRFELTFSEFDPSEIARKTDRGLSMLKKTLTCFCDCVIRELREQVDSAQKPGQK